MSSPKPKLSSFKVIGFDTMGTLIDEKAGIITASQPVLAKLPSGTSPEHLYDEFEAALATELQSQVHGSRPRTTYAAIMAHAFGTATTKVSHATYTASAEECRAFADALVDWPAFDDTVASLHALAANAKLVLLSNMETSSLKSLTTQGALKDIPIAALLGNDRSGAFKPDHRVNQNLLDTAEREFGVPKEQVLLVAQGLASDHVPAREMGVASAWIDRNGEGRGKMDEVGARPLWVFGRLEGLVREMKGEGKQ